MLQALNHLSGPLLDLLQYVNVCLVLGSPALNTALQMWPHQCLAEGNDHFPAPVGDALPNLSQDTTGLLCPTGTSAPFLQSCFPDCGCTMCTGAWDSSSPDADFAFSYLNFMRSLLAHSLACQGLSEQQHPHLVFQPVLQVLQHLQTRWGCALSHHPCG